MDTSKHDKILISILALACTAFTYAFAYSFLGYLELSQGMKTLVGFLLMLSPLSTSWVVFALWRKEKT